MEIESNSSIPAAAAPAPRDNPIARAFRRIGLLIGAPTQLFEEIKAKPDWLIAFVIAAVIAVVGAMLILPHSAQVARVSLPPDAPAQQVQAVEKMIGLQAYINPISTVVIFMIRALILAGLWTGLAVMLTSVGSFKQFFSSACYLSIPVALGSLANSAIVWLRGVDSVNTQMDMFQPLGLNLLWHDAPNWAYVLLGTINVFEIWIFALTMIAVRTLSKASWTTAAIVTFIPWALGTCLTVGSMTLFSK